MWNRTESERGRECSISGRASSISSSLHAASHLGPTGNNDMMMMVMRQSGVAAVAVAPTPRLHRNASLCQSHSFRLQCKLDAAAWIMKFTQIKIHFQTMENAQVRTFLKAKVGRHQQYNNGSLELFLFIYLPSSNSEAVMQQFQGGEGERGRTQSCLSCPFDVLFQIPY